MGFKGKTAHELGEQRLERRVRVEDEDPRVTRTLIEISSSQMAVDLPRSPTPRNHEIAVLVQTRCKCIHLNSYQDGRLR